MGNFFHRTQLAADMADKILQIAPGSASSSGLFLAAPRRTGKSTFLCEDLRPALQAQGALVLYADLWVNRKADPAMVIIAAVRSELSQHEGVISRLARSSGMDKVNVGGLFFSLSRPKVALMPFFLSKLPEMNSTAANITDCALWPQAPIKTNWPCCAIAKSRRFLVRPRSSSPRWAKTTSSVFVNR